MLFQTYFNVKVSESQCNLVHWVSCRLSQEYRTRTYKHTSGRGERGGGPLLCFKHHPLREVLLRKYVRERRWSRANGELSSDILISTTSKRERGPLDPSRQTACPTALPSLYASASTSQQQYKILFRSFQFPWGTTVKSLCFWYDCFFSSADLGVKDWTELWSTGLF